jgi:Mor family transcriptional regulator
MRRRRLTRLQAAARAEDMLQRRLAGERVAAIGRRYRLSSGRVREIIREWLASDDAEAK